MSKGFEIHFDLIEQVKLGDQAAAKAIYDLYAKAMYNSLIRLTANNQDAQDLLQESFVIAFTKIKTFRGESSFGSWLKRIVINKGLEHLRISKVKFENLELDFAEESLEESKFDGIDINGINKAIKELPAGCRTVVNLYLIEGYTHDEISEILGISQSTSKTQYMRGRQLLREKLKPAYHG